jgi:hypothetical protein
VVEVRIEPGAGNSALARRLREATEAAAQRRQYNAALRGAAKPMNAGVREDLGMYMPASGGYLAVLGGSLKARIIPERNGVTIRNTAKGKSRGRDLQALEKGVLRHPVFGRRQGRRGQSIWQANRIRAGFFTEPITKRAPLARAALVKAMRDIARQATGN